MKLHHNPMSTCSQKVRLVLAEKGLDYEQAVLDLQKGDQFAADYLALNPNAVVPTLEDRDAVLIESTLINEYLDDAYPEPALRPKDPRERHAMRLVTKGLDLNLHPACGIITYAIGVRPALLARPQSEVEAMIEHIPDPVRRANRRAVVEQGVEADVFRTALDTHARQFDSWEARLGNADWLAGSAPSLADFGVLPYVVRVDHLALDFLLAERPALTAWYDRMRARPSFAAAIEAFVPPAAAAGFRRAGDAVRERVRAILGY